MRAGEEFGEMAEYGGGRYVSGYGRTPPPTRYASAAPYEAEDAAVATGTGRQRSGIYYSPPGTSYTIVERPSSGMPPGHHTSRADYQQYNSSKGPPRG